MLGILLGKSGIFPLYSSTFVACCSYHMKHEHWGRYPHWGGLRRVGNATKEASGANPNDSLTCWSTRGKTS